MDTQTYIMISIAGALFIIIGYFLTHIHKRYENTIDEHKKRFTKIEADIVEMKLEQARMPRRKTDQTDE